MSREPGTSRVARARRRLGRSIAHPGRPNRGHATKDNQPPASHTKPHQPERGQAQDGEPRDYNLVPEHAAGGTPEAPTLITPQLLRRWSLPEPSGSKYSRGQVLVIGGSRSTPGGVLLAGEAALRMGAGRLSIAVAESIAPHLAVAMPECGVVGLPEDDEGGVTGERVAELLGKELGRADAVLVGPGLVDAGGSRQLLAEIVPALPDDVPAVLDAFGLTVLPEIPEDAQRALAGRLVLTPNTGELRRIVGWDEVPKDRLLEAVLEAAQRYGAVVGCDTLVAWDEHVWEITTGDTGLGTSGSGDVVAGAVAGLLSRGAGPAQSLVWAKHVHAAAGDALAMRYGRIGFLASELPPQLPLVLRSLRGD